MGRIRILAGVLMALAIPAAALAASSSDNTNVVLVKGDNRTGTYYVGGQNVTVDGDVAGDVVCGGQTVVINGSVDGDVICGAQTLTINGPVTGSVRAGGQVVTLNGTVGRNVTVGAQNFVLSTSAKVSGELAVGAQTVTINGPIAHAAYVGAKELTLNSAVGGNVTSYIETFTLGSAAAVTGNLDYTSAQTLPLDKSKISGTVVFHAQSQSSKPVVTPASWLTMLLYWIVASLAGALLAVWLTPRFVRGVTNIMVKRWQASLSWGALVLIAGPLVLVIMSLTVIGLPAAAVAGILWGLAIVVSGVFAGVAVGKLLFQRDDTSRRGLALAALGGIPVLVLVSEVPFINTIVGIVAAAWVLGAMTLALNRARVLG